MSIRPLQQDFFRDKVLSSAAAESTKNIKCKKTEFYFKSKEGSKNRRSLRKNKNRKIRKNLSFVGVNAAGLGSKLASFDYLLESLKPTVFFVQETKFRKPGKIKSENSKFYQVFELNRKANAGGGLATNLD